VDYFIADLHLGHKNVIMHDNRPFHTIEEHDQAIIENWNEKVWNPKDNVYIIGDISWHNTETTIRLVEALNGNKHLIVGNHDKKLIKNSEFCSLFSEVIDYKEIQITKDKGIVLCHYPIPCFNHHYRGWVHLYGHVHNSSEWQLMERIRFEVEKIDNIPCNMYNVGCMMKYMEYTPKTLEEIAAGYHKVCDDIC